MLMFFKIIFTSFIAIKNIISCRGLLLRGEHGTADISTDDRQLFIPNCKYWDEMVETNVLESNECICYKDYEGVHSCSICVSNDELIIQSEFGGANMVTLASGGDYVRTQTEGNKVYNYYEGPYNLDPRRIIPESCSLENTLYYSFKLRPESASESINIEFNVAEGCCNLNH
eukprot:395158_1